MRLLLDECVPKRLKDDLPGHDVRHVVEMGWSSRRNGELLKLMVAEHFEALLTVDQHLEFQQNVQASGFAGNAISKHFAQERPRLPQASKSGRAMPKNRRRCSWGQQG